MTRLRFIGDVHGHIDDYLPLTKSGPTFQVGDMGMGFRGVHLPHLGEDHKFIRGNHDDPRACREHPDYAGDYGYDEQRGIFWLGGGYSIDYVYRISLMVQGMSPIWWMDEELSDGALLEATAAYRNCKPRIVVSHECPQSIPEKGLIPLMSGGPFKPSRTARALQKMFEAHKPEVWIFGHYHVSQEVVLEETRFVCVGELKTFDLDL